MRTTVSIDDALMKQALALGGFTTKRAAIETGLLLVIQEHSQQRLRGLRGNVVWEGDLETMRKD